MTDPLRKAAEMAWNYFRNADDITVEGKQVMEALRQALAHPEQEPVAWLCKLENGHYDVLTDQACKKCFPVYTAPPKQWVGLTDEEIYEHEWWDEETAFAVNKELKEKNGG